MSQNDYLEKMANQLKDAMEKHRKKFTAERERCQKLEKRVSTCEEHIESNIELDLPCNYLLISLKSSIILSLGRSQNTATVQFGGKQRIPKANQGKGDFLCYNIID